MPRLTIADLHKILETEGPAAADAALQRVSQEREAEERERERKLDALFSVDAQIGTGEPKSKVITSSNRDAPADNRTEPATTEQRDETEARPSEPTAAILGADEPTTKLREIMRAKRIEIEGGIIAVDDPLRTEKLKVAKKLKKVGRTLADLPSDWDTLPRITSFPLERSRQAELYRVYREGEEELQEAERRRKLEASGRPANFDQLPLEERSKINAKLRQRISREKKRKPSSKLLPVLLPVANVAPDMLAIELKKCCAVCVPGPIVPPRH